MPFRNPTTRLPATSIDGQITSDQIADGAVILGKLGPSAVDRQAIATAAIDAERLAAEAVTTAAIAVGAVVNASLADNSVSAGKIVANAVRASEIQAGAVIAGKIATGAVIAGNIAAGAVVAGNIAANAVTATAIAANAITADKILAGSITADKISVDALDGRVITGSTVQTAATGKRVVLSPTGQIVVYSGASGESAPAALTSTVTLDGALQRGSLVLAGPTHSSYPAPEVELFVDQSGTRFWTLGPVQATRSDTYSATSLSGDLNVGADAWITGRVSAGNIKSGHGQFNPVANTPTPYNVTGLNVAGTDHRAIAGLVSSVPGTTVLGIATSDASSTGFTVWVTRTNTTLTKFDYIVIGV